MCFDFRDLWLIPVLGDSQVFLRPIRSGFFEEFTRATFETIGCFLIFLNYFSRDLGKVSKIWKNISLGFQSVWSHTFQTCQYSKTIVTYQFSKNILFKICYSILFLF